MNTFCNHTLSVTFLDDLRDWSFSFSGIWDYLVNLAEYHILQNGFMGMFVVVVIVLTAMISFPPTRHLGTLLSSNLISAAVSVVQLVAIGTGWAIAAFAARFGLSALRNFGRSLIDWTKKDN